MMKLILAISCIIGCVLSQITAMNPNDFQCLDNPRKVYFSNNASKVVPDMPTVRIMMCGYSSQCAINYAGFMFMREMLGINVSFYPTYDASAGWSSVVDDPHNSDDPGYPENYFWWLKNDHNDLNFEFWESQELAGNGLEYMLSGSVDFGGFLGAYGEESLFVPKYLVDAMPSAIVPFELKNNTLLREMLINGSRFGSTDWIDYYSNNISSISRWSRGVALNYFDDADYTKPTIWGSSNGYGMSRYAKNLTRNLHDGLNVNFVTTGGEGALKEIVSDLYSKRAAFIANIYTVDDNFATFDANTSELQQFEKMAFPRNPDNSPYDPCYLEAKCQYNVSPLMKAANPLLKTRFPEAYAFFTGFGMATTQVNLLVSKYLAVAGDATMSSSEKWLNASCEWLKDPESFSTWNVSSWLIDIERIDCLEGCGINGYGGSCDYYTGICECSYDELFADTDCKESCPGLVGPYEDNDGEMTFAFCGGHGTCDTITRLCSCDLGYGDNGCTTKYEMYTFVGLTAIVITLSAILAIIGIMCIVWLRMNAKYKTIKALSVNLTSIMTLGMIFIVCSNMALVVPVSDASCIAGQWLFGLGGVLCIMAPLLKAYRVSRVFHGGKMLRAVKITDKMLMSTLIKAALLEAALCAAYSVCHQLYGGIELYYNNGELRIEKKCNSDTITSYISMGSMAYFFCVLCALTYYSWGTRRALSVFKESTCAYFSSFLSLLCTLITFVFYMATDDPAFRVAVQSFAVILVISAVLILFYGTRVYSFFNEPENRNVTDDRAIGHTTTSAAASPRTRSTSQMRPGPN